MVLRSKQKERIVEAQKNMKDKENKLIYSIANLKAVKFQKYIGLTVIEEDVERNISTLSTLINEYGY